ncbi:MAG: hypothetical protein Kow0029_24120 [Candidatus Rifleibacteriota bacterium]
MRISAGILFFVMVVFCMLINAEAICEVDINSAQLKLNQTSDSDPDLSEVVPVATVDSSDSLEDMAGHEFNATPPPEIEFVEESDEAVLNDEIKPEPKKTYEKVDPMEPVLMVRGEPVEQICETSRKEKIKGIILPEKHYIKRRRYVYRWVLETDDGMRIPLKSNLHLLTQVRKEELLDGPVMLSGYYVQSGMNEKLRYFVVESAVPAGDNNQENKMSAKKK